LSGDGMGEMGDEMKNADIWGNYARDRTFSPLRLEMGRSSDVMKGTFPTMVSRSGNLFLSHIKNKQNVYNRFDGDTDGVYLLIVKHPAEAPYTREIAGPDLRLTLLGGRILIDRIIVKVILHNDIRMNPNLIKILGPLFPNPIQHRQRLIRLEH
jgi:hypothetical protein